MKYEVQPKPEIKPPYPLSARQLRAGQVYYVSGFEVPYLCVTVAAARITLIDLADGNRLSDTEAGLAPFSYAHAPLITPPVFGPRP